MIFSLLFHLDYIKTLELLERYKNKDINITYDVIEPHDQAISVTIYSCFWIIASLIAAVTLPNVLYHHSLRFPPLVMNRSPSPPRPSPPRCLVLTTHKTQHMWPPKTLRLAHPSQSSPQPQPNLLVALKQATPCKLHQAPTRPTYRLVSPSLLTNQNRWFSGGNVFSLQIDVLIETKLFLKFFLPRPSLKSSLSWSSVRSHLFPHNPINPIYSGFIVRHATPLD